MNCSADILLSIIYCILNINKTLYFLFRTLFLCDIQHWGPNLYDYYYAEVGEILLSLFKCAQYQMQWKTTATDWD